MGYTITTNEGAVLDAHSSPLSSSQIDEILLGTRELAASAVRTSAQILTERQQAQARSNIGAAPASGIEILGFYDSIEELNAAISGGQVRQPQPGDAYGIGIAPDYTAHMWDSVQGIWVPTRLLDRPETDAGPSLPLGGTPGQTLIKSSAEDGDAEWGQVGTAGIANGAVTLSKIASTAFDSSPVEGSGKIITSGAVAEALNNFTGGVEIVKLWENASPSSDFAAQTVTVNFSGYVCYQIAAYNRTQNVVNVYEGLVGYGMRFVYTYTTSGSDGTVVNRVGMRTVEWTNSGLEFSDGVYNGAVNNGMLLPLAIYGIKGVT